MKRSMDLVEMAQSVKYFEESKKDFLAPTSKVKMVLESGGEVVVPVNGDVFSPTSNSHSQISQFTGVPKKYYDRMLEAAPELLCSNVNHWMGAQEGTRMLRTIDGRMRAFLSDKYRPLDNWDLLTNSLPYIQQAGLEVESCDVDENRLYLKCTSPELQGEYKVGDVLQFGFLIKNNEVGRGRVEVRQFIKRLVCLNGMSLNEALRKNHVGGRGSADEMKEYYRDETRQLSDKAFWAKFVDTLRYFISERVVKETLEKLREGGERKIESTKLDQVVEITGKILGTTEEENSNILNHLAAGGDLTNWGLANAVTRAAEDCESYDRATEMEQAGHRIIELSKKEWKVISEVA